MFLQVCVILFTGGVSASVHAGIPPPQEQTPPGVDTLPLEQTPPIGSRHPPPGADPQDPPRSRHPPRADTPRSRHPPVKQTLAYGQRAAGTHPTGMHSCFKIGLLSLPCKMVQFFETPSAAKTGFSMI